MEHLGKGGDRISPQETDSGRVRHPASAGWRPSGPLLAAPDSILLIMLSAVGDAIQVLPVLSALRRSFPSAHITWVLQPGPYSLVEGHPAVDRFVLFRRGVRGRGLRSIADALAGIREAVGVLGAAARKLPGGRFDLLLALQVYLKAGLLTALAPARIKMGFDRRRARDLNWLFTTHRIPPHPAGFGHIQDQYFEFIRDLGVDPEPLDYGLKPTEEEIEKQQDFFSSFDRPACALVVGSSDPRKNWTAEGYAEVALELRTGFGLTPILVGGRSRGEEDTAREILARCRNRVVDARGGGLRRLLWLLDGSALVISPDTGPLHMARALEVPVIGLYGFTNPKRSGPYRLFTELIVDGYARSPGEDYPVSMERRAGGMGRITPEKVLTKVELALKGRSA